MAKKYIDAEKLKAEIDRRRLSNRYIDTEDYEAELYEIIDSLQQEQSAQRGYKDCNGCEYNRLLKDQIGWQFRGCFGGDYKGKPIAEIELCPLKVAQQEQPKEGYDEAYLNECIAKASKSWKGVDVDKFMDEVRGREQEQPEVEGVVHHVAKAHYIVTNSEQLNARLKQFDEGTEVVITINARKEE